MQVRIDVQSCCVAVCCSLISNVLQNHQGVQALPNHPLGFCTGEDREGASPPSWTIWNNSDHGLSAPCLKASPCRAHEAKSTQQWNCRRHRNHLVVANAAAPVMQLKEQQGYHGLPWSICWMILNAERERERDRVQQLASECTDTTVEWHRCWPSAQKVDGFSEWTIDFHQRSKPDRARLVTPGLCWADAAHLLVRQFRLWIFHLTSGGHRVWEHRKWQFSHV